MFLSLDLLSEYRNQHGAIGPLYVTSSYSTWIFYKGVSGFAIDCPCDVWCRGLTTCVLHVDPPFRNRFLNTIWAVGLTYWIVYLHFCSILTYAVIYVLIHHVIFWLYLYFLNILHSFKYSCTNFFHRRSLCTFYSKSISHYFAIKLLKYGTSRRVRSAARTFLNEYLALVKNSMRGCVACNGIWPWRISSKF